MSGVENVDEAINTEVPAPEPPAEVALPVEVSSVEVPETPAPVLAPEVVLDVALEPAPEAARAEPEPLTTTPAPLTSESVPPPPPVPAPTPPPASTPNPTAVSSAVTPALISIKDRAHAALEAIRFRKRARLDKILQLAAKKGRIKNDDVEKLLKVSDSTAQRYLNQLVLEGKLRRSGPAQNAVYERV